MGPRSLWMDLQALHWIWKRESLNPIVMQNPAWVEGVVWGIEKSMEVTKQNFTEKELLSEGGETIDSQLQ